MERRLKAEDIENLGSSRSLPTRMDLQQVFKKSVHGLRSLHTRPALELASRWPMQMHEPSKRKDSYSSSGSTVNLFGGPGRLKRSPVKQQCSPGVKMTYVSVRERIAQGGGKDIAMLTLQSPQRVNRFTSVSSSPSTSSVQGETTNSCKTIQSVQSGSTKSFQTIQRSPGRKWIYEAGVVTHDDQLRDLIKKLDDCRKQWENDGDYLQASIVAKQLQALKIFVENKKIKSTLETHAREKAAAEAKYKVELDRKTRIWGERFKIFHDEVIQHAQSLKQQHAAALQSFRLKMASKTPQKPQSSRDLLNERKVQAFLGKQGKYLEAQKVKKHADRKELKELQLTLAAYHAEVALKEQAFRTKQQQELAILFQRASQTRDELKQNKEKELACCSQHHKNILRDLDALHKQERLKQQHKMQKVVMEFRMLGGEIRDLTHAMEMLIVPTLSDACDIKESAASILEVGWVNIT